MTMNLCKHRAVAACFPESLSCETYHKKGTGIFKRIAFPGIAPHVQNFPE